MLLAWHEAAAPAHLLHHLQQQLLLNIIGPSLKAGCQIKPGCRQLS
jgi:hypothetical protein